MVSAVRLVCISPWHARQTVRAIQKSLRLTSVMLSRRQITLLAEVLGDTKSNLDARIAAEKGACENKFRIAKLAKEQGSDAIHDTVHEMAKDEARHAAGFAGLYKRFFK